MRYKHIIFDIDGTLIDTEYAVIHSLIKTITKITGNVPQYEDLKFVLGITGKDALKRLKIDDIDRGLEIWDTNMKSYYHTIHPFQGIKECLNYLLSNKYLKNFIDQFYLEHNVSKEFQKLADKLLYVREENILLAINAIKCKYQSYDDYFEKEYNLTKEKRKLLKATYCE